MIRIPGLKRLLRAIGSILRIPWDVRRLRAELPVLQQNFAILLQDVALLRQESERLSALETAIPPINDKLEFIRVECERVSGIYDSVAMRTAALEQQTAETPKHNGASVPT